VSAFISVHSRRVMVQHTKVHLTCT